MRRLKKEIDKIPEDKSRLTFQENTNIMLYYMYKIYQSSSVGNTCILLFFAFFIWLRIKIQMKMQRQMMWDQNALGYVFSKITLIPYFIKTNHLDIIYIMENGIAYLFSSRELFCHLNSTQGFFQRMKRIRRFLQRFFCCSGKVNYFSATNPCVLQIHL